MTTSTASTSSPDEKDSGSSESSLETASRRHYGMAGKSLPRKISFPLEDVFQSCVMENDNTEMWRILSSQPVTLDVNQCNTAGLTALHHAVLNNNLDGTKMLLCNGANTDIGDVHDFTPLHTAAACGYLQIASLLLLFGTDVYKMTTDGDLAIDLAKDQAMVDLLHHEMLQRIQCQNYYIEFVLYHTKELWRRLKLFLQRTYDAGVIVWKHLIGSGDTIQADVSVSETPNTALTVIEPQPKEGEKNKP